MAAPMTTWHPPGQAPPARTQTVAKLRGIRLPERQAGAGAPNPLALMAQAMAPQGGPQAGALGPLPMGGAPMGMPMGGPPIGMPGQAPPMAAPQGAPQGLPPDLWRLLGMG